MTNLIEDYDSARLLSRVLSLYYQENMKQSDIGKILGLSTPKVNRLLKQAKNQGLIQISINAPFQKIFDLEQKLKKYTKLQDAYVIPKISLDEEMNLQNLGKAAATVLLECLKPGDIICLSGGLAVYHVVNAVETKQKYDVRVVPALGGVQGRHHTDVNYLASELAHRIGGRAYEMHAPAILDSQLERDSISSLRQVKEIVELAKQSTIAMVGIGSLHSETSSFFQFTYMSQDEVREIINDQKAVGEVLAHVYNIDGQECAHDYRNRLIGINLDDLKKIPVSIGIASSTNKINSIIGALHGGIINTLVTDETAAIGIISDLGK